MTTKRRTPAAAPETDGPRPITVAVPGLTIAEDETPPAPYVVVVAPPITPDTTPEH